MLQSDVSDQLVAFLENIGLQTPTAHIVKGIIIVIVIIGASALADYLTKSLIKRVLSVIISRSKNKYDDVFLERKVFNNLSHIVPAIIIYYTIHHAFPTFPGLVNFIQDGTHIFMILVVLLVLNSFLNALHDIYQKFPIAREVPIKGYIQLVKIIIYFIGGIIVFAVIANKSPMYLFTGLGAVAAVLLLIFRDTILGFMASIQLSAYNMLKPGDWITMPSQNADGFVVDVSIASVKIQNWDKTITNIPTYSMVSNAFINWKGMYDSGGRRIKRHLLFDVNTIQFLSEKQIDSLMEADLLKPFFEANPMELFKTNTNPYAIKTNFSLFNEYVNWYIQNHPEIHSDMFLVTRQLQQVEHGIPLEIIAFTKKQDFVDYERIQGEIFNHLMALAPVFLLKIYQQPTGKDLERIGIKNKATEK